MTTEVGNAAQETETRPLSFWMRVRTFRFPPWMSKLEMILGVFALIAWFLLFAAGVSISSRPFMDRLNGSNVGMFEGLGLLLRVTLLYTVTNVGFLCLLSALLGVVGNRFVASTASNAATGDNVSGQYLAAMIGAFLLYLVIASGSFTLLGVSFKPPEVNSAPENITVAQEHYKRLATFSSIICLLEGFSPFAMNAVLRRLLPMVKPGPTAPNGS
jgi:hypothetical protein